MLDQSYYEKADEIIEFYGRKASSLIPIMQDIQAEYRYLPGELLTYVAKEIGVREDLFFILKKKLKKKFKKKVFYCKAIGKFITLLICIIFIFYFRNHCAFSIYQV